MSTFDNGLCDRLAQCENYIGSILIWGLDLSDCDLTARFCHQEIMHNSPKSLYEVNCQNCVNIGDTFQALLHLPSFQSYGEKRLTHTVLVQGVQVLSQKQQLELLRLLLHRHDNHFNHYRFILTATEEVTEIIDELKHFFDGFSYYCRPLIERKQDIILLAEFVLKCYFRQYGIHDINLTLDAKSWLRQHRWPGSSQELIRRVMHVAEALRLNASDSIVTIDKNDFIETYDKYHDSRTSFARHHVNEILHDPA